MTNVGLPVPLAMKIEFAAEYFFFVPLRKLRIESIEETGRIYFIDPHDRIVAVAKRRP